MNCKRLEGKVAVVTGGARDLGRAISVKLALDGAKVCLNYFDNEEDAKTTLEMIKKDGGTAIAVQGDMTKAAEVKNLFAKAGEAFGGKVDILVNVVGGIVGRKLITEQDEAWYDFIMDVNMRSVFLCTREVVPMMPKGGSIINFSSQAARDGGGYGASVYATAKAAVMCHTRAMAKELGPQGIRVNALAPGFFIGDQNRRVLINPDGSLTDRSKKVLAKTPMKRFGDINELNGTVQFLCSDAASFITGTVIPVDGGFSCFSGV